MMSKRDDPFTPNGKSKKKRNDTAASPNQEERILLKNVLPSESPLRLRSSPRRSVNDDEEERRRNRSEIVKRKNESKNALLSPALEASPRAEPPSSVSGTPKRSGLSLGSMDALPQPSSLSRLTASGSLGKLSSSSSHAAPATLEQMTKSFEEWMKIAADNKINSKNSWNFALIDYFSELTFLRDGDSINFQKASCTLDGCVKIYASRVDSVVDETTKLLNGLADKTQSLDIKGSNDSDGEDEGSGRSHESAAKSKISNRRAAARTVETLEKNPENLILKNFDLEFSIDPLFKKTSAEFDESGSRGALLKNLEMIPSSNLVVFDGSDQITIDSFVMSSDVSKDDNSEDLDISLLQVRFGSVIIDLPSKYISPTFEEYTFSNSNAASSTLNNLRDTLDRLSRLSRLSSVTSGISAVEGLAAGGDEFVFDDAYLDDEDDQPVHYQDHIEEEAGEDDNEPIGDFTRGSFGIVRDGSKESNKDTDSGLSYFDTAFKKTWAGPEHWKIRRSNRQSSPHASSNNESSKASNSSGAPRRASKQEKAAIDFSTTAIDFRQIFGKPASSSTITLGKASILDRNEQNHLLPADLHFTSGNLLKLFVKPNWKLETRKTSRSSTRNTRSQNQSADDGIANFVDRDYWASNNLNDKAGSNDALAADASEGPESNGYESYYNANTHHVEDDGFDDGFDFGNNSASISQSLAVSLSATDSTSANVDFSRQMVSAPRFTFTSQLNYARVAKRVDIAKLKATLWHEFLEGTGAASVAKGPATPVKVPNPQNHDLEASYASSNTFSNLIHNLSKSYPSDALAEVSVPYCFICLLHLANENNLEIQSTESDLLISN